MGYNDLRIQGSKEISDGNLKSYAFDWFVIIYKHIKGEYTICIKNLMD